MTNSGPDGQPIEPEVFEQMADAVSTTLRGVGLHATNIRFAQDPDSGQHYILGSFMIGDLATSDRVQNPEGEQVRDEFTAISQDLVDDYIAEVQRKLQQDKAQQDEEEDE